MEKLKLIVEEVEGKYVGGEAFFTVLDSRIKNDPIFLKLLLNRIERDYNDLPLIVTSGGFGKKLCNYIRNIKNNLSVIAFNGSLRKGEYPTIVDSFSSHTDHLNIVYVDDSYYSGRTFNAVNKSMNNKISQIYVVYDGSIKKSDRIKSFYRYHP